MSDSDSFINEVTEEVRRDRLYGYLRRYGWIAVLAVVVLVGGAAWNEWSKAQRQNTAQATGDAVLDALAQDDPAARVTALQDVNGEGSAIAITALIKAASEVEAEMPDAAAETLGGLAVNGDVPDIYADLAAFKAAMLDTADADARRQALSTLATPGAPFALLASEQLALLDLAEGETDAAIARLTAIIEDAGVSQGLRDRAQRLMVALDAPLPGDGASE